MGGFAVAIFEELNAAIQNRDADAYNALYSDDAVFVRHQSGTEMNKAEFSDLIKRMMASDETDMGVRRCIYENDDILAHVLQYLNANQLQRLNNRGFGLLVVAFRGQDLSQHALSVGELELTQASNRRLSRWRADHVGYVFQQANLVPVLTAYENVELPLWLLKLSRKERHARVALALEAVGLTAHVSRVLAERDIPCNVLAGYHHDHLLVPVGRADEAIALLSSR